MSSLIFSYQNIPTSLMPPKFKLHVTEWCVSVCGFGAEGNGGKHFYLSLSILFWVVDNIVWSCR